MKQRKIHCILKTNRFQRQYLTKHIYTTRRMYSSVCRKLLQERTTRLPRNDAEMKGLCKESHKAYMKCMDAQEIIYMVHELLQFQWKIRHQENMQVPSYYASLVTSKKLIWRNISLWSMIQQSDSLLENDLLYGRLYEYKHQLHLVLYIKVHKNA